MTEQEGKQIGMGIGVLVAMALLVWRWVGQDDPATAPDTATQVSVPAGLADADYRKIQTAIDRLLEHCMPLSKYWADVESAEAQLQPANVYQEREYGWQEVVYLPIRIKEQPVKIPNSFKAWGHVCHYSVGLDVHAGIDVAKEPCAKLCNAVPDQDRNTFIPFANN